jgi:hypothetical protein
MRFNTMECAPVSLIVASSIVWSPSLGAMIAMSMFRLDYKAGLERVAVAKAGECA